MDGAWGGRTMSRPPDLTGDARTDRALVTLARLLAEIADGGSGTAAIATDDEPFHPCNDSTNAGLGGTSGTDVPTASAGAAQ
jgi:hypothetical protein